MSERPRLGIFVGGASRRMGGRPKGLLSAPDTGEALLARLIRIGSEAKLLPCVVGDATHYGDLLRGVPRVADAPAGVGPLGGLAGLLAWAGQTPCVAVACDMPFLTPELLRRLVEHPSQGPILAPRAGDTERWQPLFARYEPPAVAPALEVALRAGERSFQQLFARLDVDVLELSVSEQGSLADWDRPEDIQT